jgi:predicted nucleic acid-binding protein
MAIVLDASAALSFLAASQASAASQAFRIVAAQEALLVPAIFRFEMRHALLKLERRGLVSHTALDADLALLESLVVIAPAPNAADLAGLVALARAESLGAYDAAYLDLALRNGAGLASRDAVLLEVARKHGLTLHDLR